MKSRASSLRLLELGFAGALIAACSAAGGLASTGPTRPVVSAEPSPSASLIASQPPEPSITDESASDQPSSGAIPPDPTPLPPPAASLVVEGGDPVVGELGSWSWQNAGSDAPWLPGQPIHVGAGERLTFSLSEAVAIDQWQVARVPPSSIPDGMDQVGMGEGTGQAIRFPAPPKGRWSVSVSVWFSGGGSATYYWAVTVD